MNRCPNCAAQNRDGAKFCTSCGFRLPGDTTIASSGDRSPFATTSSMPNSGEPVLEQVVDGTPSAEPEVVEWPPAQQAESDAPGLSWHSGPPKDTSIPVSDEMVAALVTDSEESGNEDVIELGAPAIEVEEPVADVYVVSDAAEPFDAADVAVPFAPSGAPTSLDGLIQLARDLEYGLVELADARSTGVEVNSGDLDARLLSGALNDLQNDEDLAPLRESIATAQERPRDVDVMLDLVLRADSIATIIAERDQLKHAIEIALGVNKSEPDPETAAPVFGDSSE